MDKPQMSVYFQARKPSAIRMAQIEFAKRKDKVKEINTAIGNVTLPTHPAMQKRMFNLDAPDSPFKNGVVKYTSTVGEKETNDAFLNVIASSGFKTEGLFSQVTDGGSQAMEILILGFCGAAGTDEKPLLLIDPAYTNYPAMAHRVGRKCVSVTRKLEKSGKFTLPDMKEIEDVIVKNKPGALVVIPYDNPTGHYYKHEEMVSLAKLCVKHNMWMLSDEAYRELFYKEGDKAVSIWRITEAEAPGIKGRRISIETTSKVWNCCGLRIGAIVTDNEELHTKAVAENTANLCSSAIGQYIFGAIAHESHKALNEWYDTVRAYYRPMLSDFCNELKERLPGIIVSSPDSSIYSVIDVREIAKPGFNAMDFVLYCAREGKVEIDGQYFTLLVAPMSGFYSVEKGQKNPGDTQMRVAYVPVKEEMKKTPLLFEKLFKAYNNLK